MFISKRPLILRARSNGVLQHIECDCACPEYASPLSSPQRIEHLPNGALLRQAPHYRGRLHDDFHVVLSPYQTGGAVVLNEPAHNVFQNFIHAIPFHVAKSSLENADFIPALMNCGLLVTDEMAGAGADKTKPEILSVWLHVTNACNIRCDYCYLKKTNHTMSAEVGEAAIAAAFRSAVENGYRTLKFKYAGGEASLNFPLVLHLHEHAQNLAAKNGLRVDEVILTNGIRWTGEMIAACKARHIRPMISLDGLGEFNDAQRHYADGAGSVESVMKTIEAFCRFEFPPHLSVTVSERNVEGLPAVVEWALQRQLTFNINFYRENDQSASFQDLRLQEARLIQMMKKAFQVIESNFPPHSLLGLLLDRTNLSTAHDTACSAGHSYLVIDQNGKIAKCQMEIERPVTTVWEKDPLRILRASTNGLQNLTVEEKEGCKECEWKYWCAGGCPAQTFRYTGRYDVKSPNCNLYKNLFPEIVRLEGLRILKYAAELN